MQNIVVSQGEQIDNLEKYVNQTVEYTDNARRNITNAIEHQKSIRKVIR